MESKTATRAYPTSLSTPALTDETTLESVIDCLEENLPIEMEGRYTVRELFEILVRAASRNDSIEHTAETLEGTLSGTGIRYHLDKFDDMSCLKEQLKGRRETLKSASYGEVTCEMRVVCGYHKGIRGQHGISQSLAG